MSEKTRQSLLDLLAVALRGQGTVPAPGAVLRGTLESGDLVADVTVRVRRRVSTGENIIFERTALALLDQVPCRAERCDAGVSRRARSGVVALNKHGRCERRPTHALVYSVPNLLGDRPPSVLLYEFVCPTHARHAAGVNLDAVLRLPSATLALLRARAARERTQKRQDDDDRETSDLEQQKAEREQQANARRAHLRLVGDDEKGK